MTGAVGRIRNESLYHTAYVATSLGGGANAGGKAAMTVGAVVGSPAPTGGMKWERTTERLDALTKSGRLVEVPVGTKFCDAVARLVTAGSYSCSGVDQTKQRPDGIASIAVVERSTFAISALPASGGYRCTWSTGLRS